jgi:signal transduction histidine kinase
VHLDPDVLGQILANLLGNVEKYAAAGGRVDLASTQAGDRTTLRVSDRGPGVPSGDRERIFEPFIRLGDGPSEGASGTGIGLTISRELARLHGGDLSLEPSAAGAVFRLELATGPATEEG